MIDEIKPMSEWPNDDDLMDEIRTYIEDDKMFDELRLRFDAMERERDEYIAEIRAMHAAVAKSEPAAKGDSK